MPYISGKLKERSFFPVPQNFTQDRIWALIKAEISKIDQILVLSCEIVNIFGSVSKIDVLRNQK